MENDYFNQTKKINPLIIGFFGTQILFAIILISILSINQKSDQIYSDDYERQPKITINGLEDISPSLPPGDQENIERKLFTAIENNTSVIDNTNITANIRNDTVTIRNYFGEDGLNYLSLIIDLPELSQSYRLFHEYDSNTKKWIANAHEFLIITCLNSLDDILYENFTCKDQYDTTIYNGIAIKYLDNLNLNNNTFSLSADNENNSILYISPSENVSTETNQQYIEQAKAAIKSIGIPSNIFEYKVLDSSNLTYNLYDQ